MGRKHKLLNEEFREFAVLHLRHSGSFYSECVVLKRDNDTVSIREEILYRNTEGHGLALGGRKSANVFVGNIRTITNPHDIRGHGFGGAFKRFWELFGGWRVRGNLGMMRFGVGMKSEGL